MMEYIIAEVRQRVVDAKAQKTNQDRKTNLDDIDKSMKLSFSAKDKNKRGKENR